MKKIAMSALLVVILSGCGNNIDLVKDGVMEMNKTTTIGKALDNWRSCESSEWKELETSSGVKVVQFICSKKISQFIEKAKNFRLKQGEKVNHLEVASIIQTFSFTINKDETFQIDNVMSRTTWKDGTSFEDEVNSIEQLESAYSNQLDFNPEALEEGDSSQISLMFSMIKVHAK